MRIGFFGYDFPHLKTFKLLDDSYSSGFDIGAVWLAPKIVLDEDGTLLSVDKDIKNEMIRNYCCERSIPVFGLFHNDEAAISKSINRYRIDTGLIGGARIIKKNVIEHFKNGIINYHPGQIPETSGLDSLYRTIEAGIRPCVTAHLIDGRVDAGRFILQANVAVHNTDDLETISKRILSKQIEINSSVLHGIANNTFSLIQINRPAKNKKMLPFEKVKVMAEFGSWKLKMSRQT